MRQRGFVVAKRLVGRQRDSHFGDGPVVQPLTVFIQIDRVCNPDGRRIAQRRFGLGKVQIAGTDGGKRYIAHCFQRYAQQQVQALIFDFQETPDDHVGRHFVCGRRDRQQHE